MADRAARGYWLIVLLDAPGPTLGRLVGRWGPVRLRPDWEGE